MDSAPETADPLVGPVAGPRPGGAAAPPAGEAAPPPAGEAAAPADGAAALRAPRNATTHTREKRGARALDGARFAILAYLGSRALLLAVAIVNGALRHHAVLSEFANWDGMWYRSIANLSGVHGGYPTHVPHIQSNLGFFPLYPLTMWVVSQPVRWLSGHGAIYSVTVAGVIVSTVGGLAATVLVQRLATGWWGEAAGRRATILFVLFPGSVVFSMLYAEGLLIPLAAGCILALQRKRWLLAGALAAVATATEPEAIVLVLVCAVSAARELHRRGWRARAARHGQGELAASGSGDEPAARVGWDERVADGGRVAPLLAPLLAPFGLIAVGAFFWAWTGTPFASWIAQRYGWKERTDPLALVHLATRLASKISFTHFNHPTINLNLVVGAVGAVFLVVALALLIKARRTVSVEALVWTLGISLIMVTAEYTPPNPRLLITAFPAVIVLAYYVKRRGFKLLLVVNGALLAGLSALTFVSVTLRP